MASKDKSHSIRQKRRRVDQNGEPNSPAEAAKLLEDILKQLILEAQALLEPSQFDPVKASRLKMEMDVLTQSMRHAEVQQQAESDSQFFDLLEFNVPRIFNTQGRPDWSESEPIRSSDKALLNRFDELLSRNITANGGREHGSSKKTYADLADELSIEDAETVKQRVMRAKRRQIALQQTMQDVLSIANQATTVGRRGVPPKQAIKNQKKLVDAFRRLLRVK
jgi:hypothetical protein